MRALGVLLVLLGLAIAAFAVRRGDTLDDAGASQSGDPSASRPIGASAATPAVPISQTVSDEADRRCAGCCGSSGITTYP
jgi:hypothetical protein